MTRIAYPQRIDIPGTFIDTGCAGSAGSSRRLHYPDQYGSTLMARKTYVELIDATDGTQAAAPVSFALDRGAYEIDLAEEHAAQLRSDLPAWGAKARRAGGRRRRGPGGPRARSRDSARRRESASGPGDDAPAPGPTSAPRRRAHEDAAGAAAPGAGRDPSAPAGPRGPSPFVATA